MDIPENSIKEIFENNPSQGTLYVLLTTMKEDGRYNLVIGECLKALLRFPDDLALRKILAEAYLGDGRLPDSEAEFGKVIKGIKNLAGVYKSQAEIYVRQKREDAAAESLKQYLAIFPEDEDAALLLEELETTGDVSPVEIPEEEIGADILEAEEPADTGIVETREQEEFPEIITASLAETYFDQGKLPEAREIYEKLIEAAPEDTVLKSRLDEISALMEPKDEPEGIQVEDKTRLKKEKMISILDSWRSNIRELAEEGVAG
ncbi:MAG: tetratricopeptide repeat protein [Desulfobacteraceae bacterium]|jgi:tetratricopeptide (TPR) repeat protein